ncbi:MAG TPA: FtsX-like permease family protein [Spirochaetia bacterium]|nr:FtsX-like permease family protein [Spirochaetia bacterium]
MLVLIRIALRNLREHTSKSLIIGTLIVLGVIIIVVGNSLLDTAERGVHRMFIDNYTGDVFLSGVPRTPGAKVSLFGLQAAGDSESTPILPEYDTVVAHLKADPRVDGVTSQLTGVSLVSVEGNDHNTVALLFGVDPETYPRMFHDTFLVQGSYLKPGQEGIVVSRGWLDDAEKNLKVRLKVGDKVILNGFGRAGFKIREATIVGVVDFNAESQGMSVIAWANADTVRILSGVDVTAEDVVLSKDETALLSAGSENDIFSASESTVSAAQANAPVVTVKEKAPPTPSTDGGSWHFLLARLKDSGQTDRFIRDTNAWLASQGIDARAGGWRDAAGPFAQSIDVVRTVFSVAILIVAIVAVIIIMNTLVISVIERTGEIGTMRALGAQRPFVWLMFLVETLTVTIVFGLVGIVLASGLIGLVNLFHLQTSSDFIQILFGGKVLRMAVRPVSFLTTLAMVALVGLVSHLYPVIVALRVPPVRAMQGE